MGYRFQCEYCSRKYKTRSSRKNHEDKSCTGSRAPAGPARSADTLASEPKKGEGSFKEMIINESNREDLATGVSREMDKGVRRPHAPRAPSHIWEREFVTTILQEPFKQGLEYMITLEGLN